MKNLPALLFCMLFSLSAHTQTWKNYFSGNTIYHIDRLDSILLVGVDNQVVAINTITGQTDFLMPPANTYGNCAPYRHVGIDADLNYWIAANAYANGLFKYEESSWQQYTSSNSTLPYSPGYLYIDHNTNTLWIECGGLTGSFDGENFNSIGNYFGQTIADKVGNLWIAQNDLGLVKYDGTSVTVFDTLSAGIQIDHISRVSVDTNNLVWFSLKNFNPDTYQTNYTIGTFDGTNWVEYSSANSSLPLIESEIIKLEFDSDNTLIIATQIDGLIEFDGLNVTLYNSALGNFPEVIITDFLIDEQGDKWIGTAINGLLKMSGTDFFSIATADNPLTGSVIIDVMVDKSGKTWAGVEDYIYQTHSLVMKNDTSWTIYQHNDGDEPGSAHAFCQDNEGNVYAVGLTGTYKFDGFEWQDYNGWGGHPVGKVGMDVDDSENVWIGASKFLIRCNGGGTASFYPPGNYNVQCVTVDDENNIWVGTDHSIHRFDGTSDWINYEYTNTIPELMSGAKGIAFDANGVLWAAGSSLLSFDGITWTAYNHPAANNLTDVVIDGGGNKWISYVGGLARFDGTDWVIFNHTNSPIIDDYMYCISVDIPNQTIWGGSYCGGLISLQDTSLIVGIKHTDLAYEKADISISPNPATGMVRIKINGLNQTANHAEIWSAGGKLMFNGSFNSNEIEVNISDFPRGIYFVSILNNKIIKCGKLIKL